MKLAADAAQENNRIQVNDQEQPYRLLKDGEVMGCISTQKLAMQGCRIDNLGCMNDRMMASAEFTAKWWIFHLTVRFP